MKTKQLIDLEDIRKVLFMTFPLYKNDIILNPNKYYLFSTQQDNTPASLVVYKRIDTTKVELVSIFTQKQHRNKSIAKNLIKFSLGNLKKYHIKSITIVYMNKKAYTDALENILDFLNFGTEIFRQSVVKNSIENFEKKARFIKKLVGLPADISQKLWEETPHNDIKKLYDENILNKWIPDDVHPNRYLENHCKEYSTALYHKDEIIGWMITHKLSNDTIRFTCSYIKEEFQYLIFQIRIYNHIKNSLIKNGIKYVSWTTPYDYKPMVNFNQKWMRKYSVYEGMSKERNLTL